MTDPQKVTCDMWLTYGHGIYALPVQRDTRFVLCPRNVHRMYLTGVLLAAKLMDDNVFNNPYWAKVTLSIHQDAHTWLCIISIA